MKYIILKYLKAKFNNYFLNKKMKEYQEKKEKIKGKENTNLSNDEALDIQIDYLQTSTKNILYSLMVNETETDDIKSKNIDKGMYLYLKNVHNKYYFNEIKYIIGNINNKISYINERNKKQKQNKDFYEREVNTISAEKIEYFDKKEILDKELELLTLNKMQNSLSKTDKSEYNSPLNTNENEIENPEIKEKNKKIEELRKKYNKLYNDISANKKEYPIIKDKNNMIQGDNMILNENLKQKQLIWDQIRKENEKIKTVVIKREYLKKEPEKNLDKREEDIKKEKTIKVNKMGSFLKNMFSKKK